MGKENTDLLDKTSSYTSASAFPSKVLRTMRYFHNPHNDTITPLHLQISLTNKCNLSCEWCSCRDRKKSEELPIQKAIDLVNQFADWGVEAITITGGGEPLLYRNLGDFVDACTVDRRWPIQLGMVTNGYLLGETSPFILNKLTWCRVSVSDDRDMEPLLDSVRSAVFSADIDWAWSYVVTAKPDIYKIIQVIQFANIHKFTHVRLVSDLLDTDNVPMMSEIKKEIQARGIDDSRVVYQGRKLWEHGARKCLISLLKPNIGTDGKIYPCCGVQYAKGESLDFDPSMCMGEDIDRIWGDQLYFDGSKCSRCYYGEYNRLLGVISTPLDHEMFV